MEAGRRHPRALASVLLNARERKSRLHMSMRKPLRSVTAGREAAGRFSKEVFWVARMEEMRERVLREGCRNIWRYVIRGNWVVIRRGE